MSKLQREVISRLAAVVVGAALLYGGWRCIQTGMAFSAEAQRRRAALADQNRSQRTFSGAGIPYMAGGLLLLVGLPTTLFALTPGWVIQKLIRPKPPETGDRGMGGGHSSGWDLLP